MAVTLHSNISIPGGVNGSTSSTLTTPASGSLIVVCVSSYSAGTGLSVTDNKGNGTYSSLTAVVDGLGQRSQIWYKENAAGGSGHTFTIGGTGVYSAGAVLVFEGAKTSGAQDQQNATAGGSSTVQPGSITPGETDEVLVTGMVAFATTLPTINEGFTVTDWVGGLGGSNYQVAGAYLIQTAIGAKNPTWTHGYAGGNSAATIASFRQATGGGSSTTPIMSHYYAMQRSA